MFKKLSLFILLLLLAFSVFACKKGIDYSKISGEKPNQELKTGDYDLDFVVMHNFVIDYITSEVMPFFFVKDNSFDISGDNEKKTITVTCTCMNGTTLSDLDLFLSMVLNGIAINASEQDYRFKYPTTDNDGTYLDYGNVFDTYDLKIHAELENKTVLRDDTFKAKSKILIDPRYIKE